jgi:hypothetical protein
MRLVCLAWFSINAKPGADWIGHIPWLLNIGPLELKANCRDPIYLKVMDKLLTLPIHTKINHPEHQQGSGRNDVHFCTESIFHCSLLASRLLAATWYDCMQGMDFGRL